MVQQQRKTLQFKSLGIHGAESPPEKTTHVPPKLTAHCGAGEETTPGNSA
jgi:hypothetical protein